MKNFKLKSVVKNHIIYDSMCEKCQEEASLEAEIRLGKWLGKLPE